MKPAIFFPLRGLDVAECGPTPGLRLGRYLLPAMRASRLLKNCSLRCHPERAGAPGDGRFCRCWGGVAKDLLFARAENKAAPSVASPNEPTTGSSGIPRKTGATSG